MKIQFTSILLLISSLSFANSRQCLESASNLELIRELEFRLNGNHDRDPEESYSVSFTCTGDAQVIVNSTNLNTGTNKKMAISTGNWDICRSLSALLNSKIGNVSLTSAKIFAVCSGDAQIIRILINTSGVKEISRDSTGNWDTCRKETDLINQALSR